MYVVYMQVAHKKNKVINNKHSPPPPLIHTLVSVCDCSKLFYILTFWCFFFRDDGGCKHVVAFLFASIDFLERHRDRGTLVGTDVQCQWNKPRKVRQPKKIADINFNQRGQKRKRDPATGLQLQKNINIERDIVKLLKTHCPIAVALNILSDSESDELASESENEMHHSTLHELRWRYDLHDKPPVIQFLQSTYTSQFCQDIEKTT